MAKIDGPLSDNQFLVYICASLTLDYWPLLTSLFISTYSAKKPIPIKDLIACIYQEADTKAVDKNANMIHENAVMIAAHLH